MLRKLEEIDLTINEGPVYEVESCNSKSHASKSPLAAIELNFITEKIENGCFVCWFYNEVQIGFIENGRLNFCDGQERDLTRYLVKGRFFNESSELHIFRQNGGFNWRYREDSEGSDSKFIDSHQILWGTRNDELGNGWTKSSEKRGMGLTVPCSMKNPENNRLVLITRSYITRNTLGQSGLCDLRFVKFAEGVNGKHGQQKH